MKQTVCLSVCVKKPMPEGDCTLTLRREGRLFINTSVQACGGGAGVSASEPHCAIGVKDALESPHYTVQKWDVASIKMFLDVWFQIL